MRKVISQGITLMESLISFNNIIHGGVGGGGSQ